MSILIFVIGILLFIGLVVVHEYGHFIMARRNGVEVEEFGIFFPPRLWKYKTKAGWLFTVNALPLGGFVKLKGEHDSDTEKGSFGAASVWVKTKIMAAGVVMNLLTALVLFTIVAMIGMPRLVDNQFSVAGDTELVKNAVQVSYIEPGSPAAKAGIQSQDELVSFKVPGNSPVGVTDAEKLPDITKSFAGQTVDVTYEREGKQQVAKVSLLSEKEVEASRKSGEAKGYFGVMPRQLVLQKSTWSAPVVAVGFTAQLTELTFKALGSSLGGLGKMIAGAVTGNTVARQNGQETASSQVSGPVAIFYILKQGSALGYIYMLMIIAIISLSLAIMNILPIPALDGGRLWLTLASHGLKKPLSPKAEEAINATGFLILMGLIVLITIVDVNRFM